MIILILILNTINNTLIVYTVTQFIVWAVRATALQLLQPTAQHYSITTLQHY